MIDAAVFEYLMKNKGEKVTLDQLVSVLSVWIVNHNYETSGKPQRWVAIEAVGSMIARREITIDANGRVKII